MATAGGKAMIERRATDMDIPPHAWRRTSQPQLFGTSLKRAACDHARRIRNIVAGPAPDALDEGVDLRAAADYRNVFRSIIDKPAPAPFACS
jgi:hypothetical protein